MVAHKTPEEKFVTFLERVATGRAGTNVAKDKDMPSWTTVWRKICDDPDFERRYMTAMASRGMVYADQLDEINNSVLSGMLDPQAARLVSDNKKWQASRLIPKVYGDRMGIESKVEAGDSFLKVLQQVNDAARLKHADVIDDENTQPQSVRAGENVNRISVNDEMPKK